VEGRIHPDAKIKLRDVPELGYFSTDKPHPRGEVCVHTPRMANGYYKTEEESKDLFEEEWFRTGYVYST
jgi:long-chain acyl-CoA synthetase